MNPKKIHTVVSSNPNWGKLYLQQGNYIIGTFYGSLVIRTMLPVPNAGKNYTIDLLPKWLSL